MVLTWVHKLVIMLAEKIGSYFLQPLEWTASWLTRVKAKEPFGPIVKKNQEQHSEDGTPNATALFWFLHLKIPLMKNTSKLFELV